MVIKRPLRVISVFGTRPEAIKMAPVVSALVKTGHETIIAVTGQHREMLRGVLKTFGIIPSFDLDIMEENQTPSSVTRKVLEGIGKVYEESRPDLVLVHGDTTTTFASALEAFYRKIPVGHVEAGLRTGDIYAPFPEELNRRLVDSISTVMYAPTEQARENLLRENIPADRIVVTGNTIIDAVLEITGRKVSLPPAIREFFIRHGISPESSEKDNRFVLVTAHRRENFGPPLLAIFHTLKRLIEKFPELKIIYPVHPNPNVRKPAYEILGGIDRLLLTEPLEYTEFINLLSRARFLMSDSGGIQEEACALGKPILVMREKTERPELLSVGLGFLVGANENAIFEKASELLLNEELYRKIAKPVWIFGDGKAGERISNDIKMRFSPCF